MGKKDRGQSVTFGSIPFERTPSAVLATPNGTPASSGAEVAATPIIDAAAAVQERVNALVWDRAAKMGAVPVVLLPIALMVFCAYAQADWVQWVFCISGSIFAVGLLGRMVQYLLAQILYQACITGAFKTSACLTLGASLCATTGVPWMWTVTVMGLWFLTTQAMHAGLPVMVPVKSSN